VQPLDSGKLKGAAKALTFSPSIISEAGMQGADSKEDIACAILQGAVSLLF